MVANSILFQKKKKTKKKISAKISTNQCQKISAKKSVLLIVRTLSCLSTLFSFLFFFTYVTIQYQKASLHDIPSIPVLYPSVSHLVLIHSLPSCLLHKANLLYHCNSTAPSSPFFDRRSRIGATRVSHSLFSLKVFSPYRRQNL